MSHKTKRIYTDDLSALAAMATERAVEARKASGIELSHEELNLVTGGAGVPMTLGQSVLLQQSLLKRIVYPGGIIFNRELPGMEGLGGLSSPVGF